LIKEPFLKPKPTLEDSARLIHLVFGSFDFATIIVYRASSSFLRPIINLEDQVSVFISPSSRVAQLYPLAQGSRFIAFYNWLAYDEDILTCLHTGFHKYTINI
jgi:hypothetical protein